ncbi:hypothetical protein Pla123a_25370 [Posidoniimonas polymericola]|uniref:Uncharacterized protein n=1 Tax=Posidoniimonas polymericola TaxID=2528002 RepID=A0A5C5YQS8_9BACT|nr:hypothetical protein [Posidoniimonas polymericola]TWT77107.1 hypothetical protein Pla123a_25370 [Posidoniimonas polymericola]
MMMQSGKQPRKAPRFRVNEVWLLLIALGTGAVWAGPSVVQWLRRDDAPQTLATPYYLLDAGPSDPPDDLSDDVQSYAPGPEFRFPRPAAQADPPRENNGGGEDIESR